MLPETKSMKTSGLEGKQNLPEGPYIKCFVIYLDFHIAKTNKDGW